MQRVFQRNWLSVRPVFATGQPGILVDLLDSVRVLNLDRVKLDDTFGQVGIVWLIVAMCAQAVLHVHGDADRNDGLRKHHQDQVAVHIQ